jgi:hypothetical protein
MLEYNYPTMYETLRTLEKDIQVALDQEKRVIHQSFHKEITVLKEPFLAEILKTYQTNQPLEAKYTASDILDILEELQNKYQVED